MTRVRTDEAARALRELLEAEITAAAGGNNLVSHQEEAHLGPVLRRAAAAIRDEGGPGTRVHADHLLDRAVASALAAWGEVNAGNEGRDGVWLARAEVAAIADKDPELGALTEQAWQRVRTQGEAPAPTIDPATRLAEVKAAAEAVDFEAARLDGWPQGTRVDARPGRPERASVPAAVLVGFDHYYRAEAADWATARLARATLGGHPVFAIYTTTDGDDEYLELYTGDGEPLASARLWAAGDLTWDPFFGRARLVAPFLALDHPTSEEGLSEPAERAAAGQVPQSWSGDVTVADGEIQHKYGRLVRIVLPAELSLTLRRREVVTAGLELIFDRSLTHRRDPGGAPLRLGPGENGVLLVGDFVRSTDHQAYEVAYWRDVDDDTYVFYFQRGAHDQLVLKVVQYDN